MIYKLVKRFQSIILVALFLICGSLPPMEVYAQTPVLKSSVDKNEILIGQQINFRVEIAFPINKYRLQWFTIPDDFNHFEIVAKDEIDSSTINEINIFGQSLTLTNFDSGRQYIPSMSLRITEMDGEKSFTMYTDSILINVMHSPADSVLPFHDIKSILEIKAGRAWWIWALIFAGGILLIILIIFLLKRFKKKRKADEVFASKLSPFEEAVQLLSTLEKEQLLEKHAEKEFHTRLSYIFKRYLSRKLNVNKMHLTTSDVLIELTPMEVEKSSIEKLANALRMGNAVKFAKYIPPVAESVHCKNVVREVITEIHSFTEKKDTSDR